jgi:hypothetical protein
MTSNVNFLESHVISGTTLHNRLSPDRAQRIPVANSPETVAGANNPLPSLDEAIRQLSEHEATLRYDRLPASHLRVEADRLIAGGREYQLGSGGMERLCGHLRAPADYIGRLPAELRARLLQHHLQESSFADRNLSNGNCLVISRDGAFVNLGRSDLYTLNSTAVLQAVREGVRDDAPTLAVQNLRTHDESFAIDLVSPAISQEVRRGDIIRGGVHVEHSPVSAQATLVLPYVVRLLCINGLVQRQCLGQKRSSRSTPRTRRLAADREDAHELQVAQIRRLVGDAWLGLRTKLETIRCLQDERVDVEKTLEQFLRQARMFSRALMQRLLRAWQDEVASDRTAFGLLNALTWVATHSDDLSYHQRGRLARLAGIFANRHVHLCPQCFSVLNGPAPCV